MKLYVRQSGDPQNPAIVIIHGLAGTSLDWAPTAKTLAPKYCVYTPDMRNHGKSPHSEAMNYDCLTEDLTEWVKDAGITRFHLIGHSIGGKNAMLFACRQPEYVKSLTVIDIAPKAYDPTPTIELDAMAALEARGVKDIDEARRILKQDIPDKDMLDYLLDAFTQDASGHYRWEMNLPLLVNRLKELRKNALEATDFFTGPTLFIRAGKSVFTEDADTLKIKQHFPHAAIKSLADANHFPHRSVPQAFISLVSTFIAENEP